MNWNWIRSTKFETLRIHFCDVFGLLSFRNFATMATLPLRRKIILHFLSPHLGFSAMLSISFVDPSCCWNHSVEQNVSQKLLKIADTLKQKMFFEQLPTKYNSSLSLLPHLGFPAFLLLSHHHHHHHHTFIIFSPFHLHIVETMSTPLVFQFNTASVSVLCFITDF